MTRNSVEAIVRALETAEVRYLIAGDLAVVARFLSLADLRAMKRAADGPVDRLDLEALARLHPEERP